MDNLNKDELSSIEAVNLSDIKIISTTGTPSDCVVIASGKQLKGVKSIRFEIDTTTLVGKVVIEAYVKDMVIDAKAIDTTIVKVKEENNA